jgi:DNA-binding HxlR family transcriptional regulator
VDGTDELTQTITPYCAQYHRAIDILGRRWTGLIVRALLAGITRFGELKAAVPGLSDRLLSERLKELEAEGIVVRSVTPCTPVRIDYALTEKGRSLAGVVAAISDWAVDWVEPVPTAPARGPAASLRRI